MRRSIRFARDDSRGYCFGMTLRILGFGVAVGWASPAFAQDTATTRLPAMVTVTRQAARSPFDLPFGITTVSPDSLRPGQAHIAADQTLLMIPGLTVANRTNPSQRAQRPS